MPLMPKRTKYRKQQKGRNRGKATRGTEIKHGEFGIQSLELGEITSNQIEAARVAMTRYIKRGGKVWITIFPDKPITKKPADTRMGKGKGSVEYWVAVVKPGRVMFEVAEIPEDVAREALRLAANKLSVKCKFVKRELTDEERAEIKKHVKERPVELPEERKEEAVASEEEVKEENVENTKSDEKGEVEVNENE